MTWLFATSEQGTTPGYGIDNLLISVPKLDVSLV